MTTKYLLVACSMMMLPTSLSAQTLEQSYANLCTDEAKETEACQVMLKALREKQTTNDRKVVKASSPKKGTQRTAPKTGKWGFWASLPEQSGAFYAPSSLLKFHWRDRDRILSMSDELSNFSINLELGDDGMVILRNALGPEVKMTPQPDGSFLYPYVGNDWQQRYKLSNGTLIHTIEQRTDGIWINKSETRWHRLSPEKLAEAHAAIEEAKKPQNWVANWGIYANIPGRTYVYKLFETRYVHAYDWVVPGISISWRVAAMTKNVVTTKPTPPVGAAYVFDPIARTFPPLLGKLNHDGSVTNEFNTMRTISSATPDGYVSKTAKLKNGKWKHMITERYVAVGGPDIEAVLASLSAPQKSGGSGGGGLFAAMVGGLAAGYSSGMTESNAQVMQQRQALKNIRQNAISSQPSTSNRNNSSTLNAPPRGNSIALSTTHSDTKKPAPPADIKQVNPINELSYFSCSSIIRKVSASNSLYIDTTSYGVVTSRKSLSEVRDSFKNRTGATQGIDVENGSVSCMPHETMAKAKSQNNAMIEKDKKGNHKQVTNVDYSF